MNWAQEGIPGEDGDDGAPGGDGAPGDDGQSAYEIWLNAGDEGTEDDFLASLKGDKGDNGEDGQDGAPGPGFTNGVGPSAATLWISSTTGFYA